MELKTYSKGIKEQLITNKIVENKCAICGLGPSWNDQPLVFHLDHIDGDRNHNTLDNLRLLCPNCHTQTPTYAGRNIKKQKRLYQPPTLEERKTNTCSCGNKIYACSNRCRSCSLRYKILWPDLELLIQEVQEKGYRAVGRKLGVSDNAIRKYIKNNS